MKFLQLTRLWFTRESSEHEPDQEAIDGLMDELQPILEKYGVGFSMADTFSLNKEKFSIYNCERCKQYFVNRDENPAGLDKDYVPDDVEFIIYDGGGSEGSNLCESCLPLEHRWGHSS